MSSRAWSKRHRSGKEECHESGPVSEHVCEIMVAWWLKAVAVPRRAHDQDGNLGRRSRKDPWCR